MDVKEEDILGPQVATHWYYVAKGWALLRALRKAHLPGGAAVLDVGAGSGVFSKMLLQRDVVGQAVCVDPAYAAERDETHAGKPLCFRHQAPAGTAAALALFMDVLEHVEDDVGLLQHYLPALAPGGHVLISVPAFQFLFSGHDVFLAHHQRYTLGGIRRTVQAAGLEPVSGFYFYGSIFPIAAAKRLVDRIRLGAGRLQPKSDLALAPTWLNATLKAVLGLEAVLIPLNKLFGLSAFVLARHSN